MNWYYGEGTDAQGPVDETMAAELVRQGRITRETMVRSERMAEWLPASSTPLARYLTAIAMVQGLVHSPALLTRSAFGRAVGGCVAAVLLLALAILLIGPLYAINKAPFPKGLIPSSGNDVALARAPVEVLTPGMLQDAMMQVLSQKPPRPYLRNVFEALASQTGHKTMLAVPFTGPLVTPAMDSVMKKLQAAYATVMRRIEESSYYSYRYDDDWKTAAERLQGLKTLREFAQNPQLHFGVRYEVLDTVATHRALVAYRPLYSEVTTGVWVVTAVVAGPVIDSAILVNTTARAMDLSRDRDRFLVLKNRTVSILTARNKAERAAIRAAFYHRWYQTLVLWIVSLAVLAGLWRYQVIIRRKRLPRKSTHNIYFATNTTSLLLRAVAVLVVGLGGLAIVAVMLMVLVAGQLPESLPLFTGLRYASAALAPLALGLGAVILSWGFVLSAEFLCFLSNCYHAMFMKAYALPGGEKPVAGRQSTEGR